MDVTEHVEERSDEYGANGREWKFNGRKLRDRHNRCGAGTNRLPQTQRVIRGGVMFTLVLADPSEGIRRKSFHQIWDQQL